MLGGLTLTCEGRGIQRMVAGDSCVVPAQQRHALTDCSDDLELLEVSLPAALATLRHSVSVEALMNFNDQIGQ